MIGRGMSDLAALFQKIRSKEGNDCIARADSLWAMGRAEGIKAHVETDDRVALLLRLRSSLLLAEVRRVRA